MGAACEGLEGAATPAAILEATLRDLYDGVPMDEVRKSAILAARSLIEKDPSYSYVTARLLLHTIRLEVIGEEVSQAEMGSRYAEYFPQFIELEDFVEGGEYRVLGNDRDIFFTLVTGLDGSDDVALGGGNQLAAACLDQYAEQ